MLTYVNRRIGLQILHKLSIPLEAELYIYNQRHPGNKEAQSLLNAMPRKYIKHRKKALKQMKSGSSSYVEEEEEEEEEEMEIPDEHECAICCDLLCNPCVIRCEHVFCRLCLMKVAHSRLKKYLTPLCPLCMWIFSLFLFQFQKSFV